MTNNSLKKISTIEFSEIETNHQKWLSKRADGIYAQFNDVIFSDFNMFKCNLSKATFINCEFENITIEDSLFDDAVFINTEFKENVELINSKLI